jgi:Fic family protein
MDHFLQYDLPPSTVKDYVLFSGIAHLWFLTIHPFDDGNGRIARAISDYYLAKAEQSPFRYYSLSAEILARRSEYYKILEQTQHGDLIITEWMLWYLDCLLVAVRNADQLVQDAVRRGEFWQRHAQTVLSARQQKVLNNLLDNYQGKMTTSRWSRICKCSRDTALRDINDLVAKGILRKGDAGSRSTGYYLVD